MVRTSFADLIRKASGTRASIKAPGSPAVVTLVNRPLKARLRARLQGVCLLRRDQARDERRCRSERDPTARSMPVQLSQRRDSPLPLLFVGTIDPSKSSSH